MRRIIISMCFAVCAASAAEVAATVRTSAGLTVNGATVPVGVPTVLVASSTKISTGAAPTVITTTSGTTTTLAAQKTIAAPAVTGSEEPPPILLGPPVPSVSFFRRNR